MVSKKITLSGVVTSSNDATYTRNRDKKLIVCADCRVSLGEAKEPITAIVRVFGKVVPEVGKVWTFAPNSLEYSREYDSYKIAVFN